MSDYRFQINGHDYRVECSGTQAHGHLRIVADNLWLVTDSSGYCNPEDDIYKHHQAHLLRGAAKAAWINARMREAVIAEIDAHAAFCLQMIADGLIDPATGADIE